MADQHSLRIFYRKDGICFGACTCGWRGTRFSIAWGGRDLAEREARREVEAHIDDAVRHGEGPPGESMIDVAGRILRPRIYRAK